MKITQLLTDLNEAGARSAAQQASMKSAATGIPQANNPFNLKVMPGGKGTSAPTQQAAKPVSFGKGTAMPIKPMTVPGAGTSAAPKTTTAVAPQAANTQQPSGLKKALNYANSAQSGKDIAKFGRGMADAGGALNRGAQTVAKGAGSLVKGIGQGVGSALSGIGSVAKGVGDVAAQTVGGVAQSVGAAAGGLKHGYQSAGSGQKFGGGGYSGTPTGISGSDSTPGGGNDEVSNLRSTLQAMDARLRRAGI
jgi:uncharacterized phage infection (PIP) family protein YhgE